MKRKRFSALAFCTLLLSGLCGCDSMQMQEPAASSADTAAVQRIDIDAYKETVEALKELWKKPDCEAQVQQSVTDLLQAVDEAYAAYIHAEIAFYSDWNNDALSEQRNAAYEDYTVVSDMTRWAIVNGCKKSEYTELFEPYITFDAVDYYAVNSLVRVISYARKSAGESSGLLEDYYAAAYEGTADTSERNRQCAQLYLDILDHASPSDYDYEAYLRDYTPDEVKAVYDDLMTSFMPVYVSLREYLLQTDDSLPQIGDAMELLQTYAPKLSPEIADAAEELFAKKLYTAVSGDNCYDGSFTAAVPAEHTALLYLYFNGDLTDLTTAVHEFGHFCCDRSCDTPVLLQNNCVDIAELQSQGMEVLFTSFYGELMPEGADIAELIELFSLMDAVVSGFSVGRFESDVMERADTLKPDEVLELYDRYCKSAGIGLELYEIPHLYEQPGYYVSYGVSALAALQLYIQMQNDRQGALQSYDRLSHISGLSGEYRFRQALDTCGLSDVFGIGFTADLSEGLRSRISELQS